jgi:hypothetical protein
MVDRSFKNAWPAWNMGCGVSLNGARSMLEDA